MESYKLLVGKNVCWTEKIGLNLNKQKNKKEQALKKQHTCKPNALAFNNSVKNNNGAEKYLETHQKKVRNKTDGPKQPNINAQIIKKLSLKL